MGASLVSMEDIAEAAQFLSNTYKKDLTTFIYKIWSSWLFFGTIGTHFGNLLELLLK
jgi:hypothetical protein